MELERGDLMISDGAVEWSSSQFWLVDCAINRTIACFRFIGLP